MKNIYQLLFILTSYNVYKEHPVIDSARKNIRHSKSPKRNTTKWHGRGNTFPRSIATVGDKHVGFVWGQWNSEIYIGRTDKEQANPELFMEGNGIDCSKGTFFP